MQRVPRYSLLLRELRKQTDPAHADFALLGDAIETISAVASRIDDAVGEHKQFVARLSIWNECGPECDGRNVLVEGRARSLLAEGPLVVASSTSVAKQHCFLFSDSTFLTGTPRPAGRRLSLLKALDRGAGGGGLGGGRGLIGAAERRRRSMRSAAATAEGVRHGERPPLAAIATHELCELLSVPSTALATAATASRAGVEATGPEPTVPPPPPRASRDIREDDIVLEPISVVTSQGATLHLSAPSNGRRDVWLSRIAAVLAARKPLGSSSITSSSSSGGGGGGAEDAGAAVADPPVLLEADEQGGEEQGGGAASGAAEEDEGEESAY